MKATGLEPERLKMGYCTAAEGQKFQKEATEFDKVIKGLGPNPIKAQRDASKKKKAKA